MVAQDQHPLILAITYTMMYINIRKEYLMPYRAVKFDCVKLKGFFSHNSVIPCILNTHYIAL